MQAKSKIFRFLVLSISLLLLFAQSCKKECEDCYNPPQGEDQTFSVNENSPNGTSVGFVIVDNGITEGINFYFLEPGYSEAFIINENSGEITVYDSTLLDFESQTLYSMTVLAVREASGLSGTINVNITVNDIDDNTIPTEGLIAYYPFNGNADDESENGNNGTVYGATLTTDYHGNANSAFYFDGINDYIDCGNSSLFNLNETGSIGLFINVTNYPSFYTSIIAKGHRVGDFGGYGIWYHYTAEKILGSIRDNDYPAGNRMQISFDLNPENSWHYYTLVWDSDTIRSYVDGILLYKEENSTYAASNSTSLTIAMDPTTISDTYFEGVLDEIVIYNRALNAEEVDRIYKTVTD